MIRAFTDIQNRLICKAFNFNRIAEASLMFTWEAFFMGGCDVGEV